MSRTVRDSTLVAGLLACSIAKQRCITMGTKGIEIVGMDGQMLKK